MSKFKLDSDPVSFQLSYHFNNIIIYFHPLNEDIRLPSDKGFGITSSEIIDELQLLLKEESLFETDLSYLRYFYPLKFRLIQLIQHYGADVVQSYVSLVYSKAA